MYVRSKYNTSPYAVGIGSCAATALDTLMGVVKTNRIKIRILGDISYARYLVNIKITATSQNI